MANPHGLDWSDSISHYPIWTAEPDISTIRDLALTHLGIKDGKCDVSLLEAGDKNMIYAIDTDFRAYIMRVGLPMDPLKVASEVATMNYVRAKTSIPVPKIIAYEPFNDGPLRFPWILMERAKGKDVFETWRAKPMEGKRKIVTQLVDIQCQLDTLEFEGIGSLINHGPDTIVSRLAIHDYHRYPHSSDPRSESYRNAHDWLKDRFDLFIARFKFVLIDFKDDEDYLEWARRRLETAQAMLDFLPRLFPPNEPLQRTTLVHSDLHGGNIMIDEDDNITGILDWEFQHTSPVWRAQAIPSVLMSLRKAESPSKAHHLATQDESWHPTPEERAKWDGLNPVYWEELEQYEGTILRKQYIDEMDIRSPGWKERYEATKFHRMIDMELFLLEYNQLGEHVECWLKQYTGEGKNQGVDDDIAQEDIPCFNDRIDEMSHRMERKALESSEGDSEQVDLENEVTDVELGIVPLRE